MKKHSKYIYITPLTTNAKFFFNVELDSFHTCKIEEETDERYLVSSINQKRKFWIDKNGNSHWTVTK
jgi:hypothetical protein